MTIRKKLQSFQHLRAVLLTLLSILFITHIVEYNGYMNYEDTKTHEDYETKNTPSYEIEQQFYVNSIVEPTVIDYDLSTKRDNTLFKLMMDLFVISLLYPRKNEE